MLIGALLLGAGGFIMLRKADAQLDFAAALLNRRCTIAKTGINTAESKGTANPTASAYEDYEESTEDREAMEAMDV